MSALFYISAIICTIAGLLVVTRTNAMHALVFLVVLILSSASVFYSLGAPLAAVLQILIYAGAIMVLFVFVVMLLNIGSHSQPVERRRWRGLAWLLPITLVLVLLVQFVAVLAGHGKAESSALVGPKLVGISLYTKYIPGVELASLLLLAALVAAFHLGALPSRQEAEDA